MQLVGCLNLKHLNLSTLKMKLLAILHAFGFKGAFATGYMLKDGRPYIEQALIDFNFTFSSQHLKE